jgi:hypothetical protein
MHRVVAAFSVVVALILSVSPAAGAAPPPSASASPAVPAAAGSFGNPVRILESGGETGIDMAVAADGHVHLVASDGATIWYATDRTGEWTARRIAGQISGGGNVWVGPSIAVDGNERVHIVALRALCHDCGPEDQRYSYGIHYLTDMGRERGTFPARPERLTSSGQSPSIAARGGTVMVAYSSTPRTGEGTLQLLTKAGDGWTRSTIAPHGGTPSLQVGGDGRPRVAFVTEHGLRYARATATGDWVVERVTRVPYEDNEPALAVDAKGGAHISTIDWAHMTIRYTRRTDDGWTAPMVIAHGRAHDISVQRTGQPWVLVGDRAVQAYRPVGGDFVPRPVSAHDVPDGHVVAIAVMPSGSVIAAWYGSESHEGDMGVWISRT